MLPVLIRLSPLEEIVAIDNDFLSLSACVFVFVGEKEGLKVNL